MGEWVGFEPTRFTTLHKRLLNRFSSFFPSSSFFLSSPPFGSLETLTLTSCILPRTCSSMAQKLRLIILNTNLLLESTCTDWNNVDLESSSADSVRFWFSFWVQIFFLYVFICWFVGLQRWINVVNLGILKKISEKVRVYGSEPKLHGFALFYIVSELVVGFERNRGVSFVILPSLFRNFDLILRKSLNWFCFVLILFEIRK